MMLPGDRPPVSEIMVQLYGRPVHPELFEIAAMRAVTREDYRAKVWITRTGHVITWEQRGIQVSEVVHADPELALSRRLVHHRLRGEHSARVDLDAGVVYQASYQVERLTPDVFLGVQDEILADGARRGMLHTFGPQSRITLAPIAHILMEAKPGCLFLTTFHTFPDELAVVKSQSLIEMPR